MSLKTVYTGALFKMGPVRAWNMAEACETRPRGYKKKFMLNSTEQEILTAHKNLNTYK